MKHLNPRQGITTGSYRMTHCLYRQTRCVKHLNPRQGITTDMQAYFLGYLSQMGVKHLNPRQGITTQRLSLMIPPDFCSSRVKHLNPRQGITTIEINEVGL